MKSAVSEAGTQHPPGGSDPSDPGHAGQQDGTAQEPLLRNAVAHITGQSMPNAPTAAGLAVTNPVANMEGPMPLMIRGGNYATP
jgi:hypothetical protein